ncbi:hypothetical protein ACFX15_029770 [Malus domestica]
MIELARNLQSSDTRFNSPLRQAIVVPLPYNLNSSFPSTVLLRCLVNSLFGYLHHFSMLLKRFYGVPHPQDGFDAA